MAGEESVLIGNDPRTSKQGTFVFNGKNREFIAQKDYTAVINADHGMIINSNTPTAYVALTVSG